MKNIRGTAAYWKNALLDLLAMLKSLGPPTLFITLSANDCHWPELVMTLTGCDEEHVADYIHDLPLLVKKDPYLTAVHFERRYSALYKHILKAGEKPLGDITDFFVRVEFQNRGSPHYHLFYWIKDIPIVKNSTTAKAVVEYIDKVIYTRLPDKKSDPNFYDLVKQLQTHRHSQYCMKRRQSCRFGFPFPSVAATHLLSHSNVSVHGRLYASRRGELDGYINAYNPTILRHFQSNMDIQLVNNAESAAYYVCAYLCKAEPDELKVEFSKLIAYFLQNEQNLSLHTRLLKIGTCVLKNRRLSAQEAAFRMSKLKLIQSSRNVIYINCRESSKRMKILKPFAERCTLDSNSTDVFHTNIIDYYYDRPLHMENMSLFQFASTYQVCQNNAVGDRALPRYKLQTINKWIRQKKVKNVVRTPHLQFNSEGYFFSLLMLLLPHRHESNLIKPYSSAKEALLEKHALLDQSFSTSNAALIDQLEAAVRMIRITQEDILDSFRLSSLNEPDNNQNETVVNSSLSYVQQTPPHVQTSYGINHYEHSECHLHSLQTTSISDVQLMTNISMLTADQRNVFNYVKTHFSSTTKGLQLFVTGGAGVGKSFLLSVLANFLSLTCALSPGHTPVLLTAPTGTAARNIHGQTLHSALYLPIENKQYSEKRGISGKTHHK